MIRQNYVAVASCKVSEFFLFFSMLLEFSEKFFLTTLHLVFVAYQEGDSLCYHNVHI